jgi:hypothetical protein
MKRFLLTTIVFFLAGSLSLFAQANGNNDDCVMPEITETSGGGSYCMDEEVTLSITGDLNDATGWEWYANGDCEGDPINEESASSITVTVTETITYSVRGVGGCVDDDEEGPECVLIEVVLDDVPPEVDCPENIEVENLEDECYAVVEFDEPTGTDNCSEEVTVEQTEGLESGDQFPVGVTTQTYILSDEYENETTCSFTITVLDTQAPEITCPVDIEADNDPGKCSAVVEYELPEATDNCPGVTIELTEGLESGASFPVGSTSVTYTASDASGNTGSCSFDVTVYDVEPPVITVKNIKSSKWPPNHKNFEVEIEDYIISVEDNCTDLTVDDIIIDDVSSDEPQNDKGDGNTEDDIVISEDCKTVSLLAERQGGGNGRVYTINLAVADEHGNIGVAEIKAEVPHDQGKKGAPMDDGPEYVVNGCDIEVEDEIEGDGQEVNENSRIVHSNVEIFETYPNPFTSSFEILFKAETEDHVDVVLYSFTGSLINELYKGNVKAEKEYSWTYDSGNLNDELYLLIVNGKKSYAFKRIVRK